MGALGLSTPLIYGGGVRHAKDAVKAVTMGADRISVDALLWDSPQELESISREIGTQAIIVNMPVRVQNNVMLWRNYYSNREVPLNNKVLSQLYLDWVSEVMLSDWEHEGVVGTFDLDIPKLFPSATKPLIVFGGLSDPDQLQEVMSRPNVVAAGMGNFLSYREHALQKIRQQMAGSLIRAVQYACDK